MGDDVDDPILQFFGYAHLPPHLQGISKLFGDVANEVVNRLPDNIERAACLRKLLEAKDAGVRAWLFKDEP